MPINTNKSVNISIQFVSLQVEYFFNVKELIYRCY